MDLRSQQLTPLEQIRPNAWNVRCHSKRQIRQIADSIAEFGFTSPIIIDEAGNVLAGHGRLAAARLLNLPQAPTITVTGLSDVQKRGYILADNKLVEKAGYDRAGLAIELADLGPLLAESGLSIEITGFEPAEVDALCEAHLGSEQDPADVLPKISPTPVSCRGDLWQLGAHRLLVGNARVRDDVRRLMEADLAAMVFTDPPYNVRISSVQGRGKIKHREFAAASGEMSPEAFTEFLRSSLALAGEHSADGSIHFVFSDWRHMRELLDAGEAVYGSLKNLIVWAKTNAGQGTFYRSQHELIFVFKNGSAPHINTFELGQHGRYRSNLWTYPGVNTFRPGRLKDLAVHPTVKPVRMVADAMRDCSRRGDIVLDSFLGSGTSIMAAETVGRRCYGLEIDPLYADSTIRRWQDFTKRDAVLDGGRLTFCEIESERQATRSRKSK